MTVVSAARRINESAWVNLIVGGGLITAANVLIQLKSPLKPPADAASPKLSVPRTTTPSGVSTSNMPASRPPPILTSATRPPKAENGSIYQKRSLNNAVREKVTLGGKPKRRWQARYKGNSFRSSPFSDSSQSRAG